MFLLVLIHVAGSRLEKAIQEGTDALNRFITAGEVDQLSDIIKKPGEEKDGEEPAPKKSRFDRVVNHNVQIIYKESNNGANSNQSSSFIPPLMALNVDADMMNGPDYRMPPTMIGDMHGWAPAPLPAAGPQSGGENWTQPPIFANGQMGASNANQPPSLLNMNLGGPFGDTSPGSNWTGPPGNFNRPNMSAAGGSGSTTDGNTKRRNRDSDGNRISRFDSGGDRPSRFDNNERNRRGNNNSGNGNWSKNNRRI